MPHQDDEHSNNSGYGPRRETTTFPLMDLPPELWTRIVKLSVMRDIKPWQCVNEEPIDFGLPPLAWTCRAVRAEAVKSYYKYNTFKIHGICSTQELLRCERWIQDRIEKGQWAHIKHVFICPCCVDVCTILRVLQRHFSDARVKLRRPEPLLRLYEVRVDELTADEEGATAKSGWIFADEVGSVTNGEELEASEDEVETDDEEAGAGELMEPSDECERETEVEDGDEE